MSNTIVFLIAAAIIGLAVGFAILDQSRWDDFSQKHHCKVIAKTAGYKTGTYWVPGTTTYKCDDGVEYTR